MKQTIITLIGLLSFGISNSQGFININKNRSKAYLVKFSAKEKLQTVTTETDSTLTFLIRDTSKQNLDLVLHFDASGKCDKEVRTLTCDSCCQKMVAATLSNKTYRWTKVDEKTYQSKKSKGLELIILPAGSFSFVVQRRGLVSK